MIVNLHDFPVAKYYIKTHVLQFVHLPDAQMHSPVLKYRIVLIRHLNWNCALFANQLTEYSRLLSNDSWFLVNKCSVAVLTFFDRWFTQNFEVTLNVKCKESLKPFLFNKKIMFIICCSGQNYKSNFIFNTIIRIKIFKATYYYYPLKGNSMTLTFVLKLTYFFIYWTFVSVLIYVLVI